MTPKSILIVTAAALATAGLATAIWWTAIRAPARLSLADYLPNTNAPSNRAAQPTTRPLERMSLPWSPGTVNTARGNNAGAIAEIQRDPDNKPSRAVAALPWGAPAKSRGSAESKSQSAGVNPSVQEQSLVEVATKLKFSPNVISWLGTWEEKVRANDPAASSDVAQFEQLLVTETATVPQLLSLMRATESLDDHPKDRHTNSYPPVTGAIACRAVVLGTASARRDPKLRYLAMNQVAPLIERLWIGPERDARAVFDFYSTLGLDTTKGSPDWIRGHVGALEALYKQNRDDEALAAVDAIINDPELSDAQKLQTQYLRGAIMFYQGRPEEAVAPLKIAATASSGNIAGDARQLLAYAYARCGDRALTADALKAYIAGRSDGVTTAEKERLVRSLRDELIRAKQTGQQLVGRGKI